MDKYKKYTCFILKARVLFNIPGSASNTKSARVGGTKKKWFHSNSLCRQRARRPPTWIIFRSCFALKPKSISRIDFSTLESFIGPIIITIILYAKDSTAEYRRTNFTDTARIIRRYDKNELFCPRTKSR